MLRAHRPEQKPLLDEKLERLGILLTQLESKPSKDSALEAYLEARSVNAELTEERLWIDNLEEINRGPSNLVSAASLMQRYLGILDRVDFPGKENYRTGVADWAESTADMAADYLSSPV